MEKTLRFIFPFAVVGGALFLVALYVETASNHNGWTALIALFLFLCAFLSSEGTDW